MNGITVLLMTTRQLIIEAMDLPLSERVSLAQVLWQSIESGLVDADEQSVVRETVDRDQDLSSGAMQGRSHQEVMEKARRSIGCV